MWWVVFVAKHELEYVTEVIYLNNSPHIVRNFVINEDREKVFHSEKRYPVVIGNMSDAEAAKKLGRY